MKLTGKFVVVLALIGGFFTSSVNAQDEGEDFIGDFTYDRISVTERKAIPYPHLREADVMFSRRIHRIVDSREKQNMVMKWPKNPFYTIIYDAVTEGVNGKQITPYKNDSLSSYYTVEEVLKRGATEEVIPIFPDPNDPEYYYDSLIRNPYRASDIIRYRVMEDWIFDKQRSIFEPRIIGIAPLFKPAVEGVELGEQPLFWVNYKDLRNIIINERIFNRHNDAMQMTYADFFEQRLFSSYVIKEPNEFDFEIGTFEEYQADAFGALLESERIKEELFNWEHDLWEY